MTMSTMIKPPRTLLEVFQLLPEGTLAQLIQNEIVMSPSPLEVHQLILMNLSSDIHVYVKKKKMGQVRVAPYDVYLNKRNVYQPDILFIANSQKENIKEDGFHGAPDLIIEILSPSTAKYDLEEKKDVYEQYGVKEYIIVNPADKTVTVYELENGEFAIFFTGIAAVKSKLLEISFEF
jgi:Uma2 family endonuclease